LPRVAAPRFSPIRAQAAKHLRCELAPGRWNGGLPPAFAWCQPTVAHLRRGSRPVVRRIVRWANNVSRGKKDQRQTLTPAEFVHGGTIRPVRERVEK